MTSWAKTGKSRRSQQLQSLHQIQAPSQLAIAASEQVRSCRYPVLQHLARYPDLLAPSMAQRRQQQTIRLATCLHPNRRRPADHCLCKSDRSNCWKRREGSRISKRLCGTISAVVEALRRSDSLHLLYGKMTRMIYLQLSTKMHQSIELATLRLLHRQEL